MKLHATGLNPNYNTGFTLQKPATQQATARFGALPQKKKDEEQPSNGKILFGLVTKGALFAVFSLLMLVKGGDPYVNSCEKRFEQLVGKFPQAENSKKEFIAQCVDDTREAYNQENLHQAK